jgi:hypothetical protein
MYIRKQTRTTDKGNITYPVLMISNHADEEYQSIVLFSDAHTGTVLMTGTNTKRAVGDVEADWVQASFVPYNEELVISN